MANIPVERKGGVPGWVWLLLALLLALALLFLFGDGCNDEVRDDAVLSDTAGVYTDTSAYTPMDTVGEDDLDITGPADIEDLNLLFSNASSGSIVGQSVRFSDVVAYNVVGDSTFYVQSGSGEAFVVLRGLGESQSTGGCTDGRYCIQEGDTLDLVGRVRALDEALRADWTIRPEAAQGYYIDARRVDV